MIKPRYITVKEIILLNGVVIKRYTPLEKIGIKDYSLVDSALNRPKATWQGVDLYPDIWSKGAALYASICQNHGFYSANKRTGFAAMKQFLWLNGFLLDIPEQIATDYTLFVVNQKPKIAEISDWLENHSTERP